MAVLEDVVTVDISVSSRSPSRATFAVPLIVGFHTRFAELVRTYNTVAQMEADGFTSEDAEHALATSILSQSPTVPRIKVGRLTGAQVARVVKLLATARNSSEYSIIINGRTFSFTSDGTATALEIATGLVALVNADLTLAVTASLDGSNLVLTADVAGPDFFVDVADEALWASIQDTTAARGSLAADLAAILVADADWYALCLTRQNHLDAAAAAAFVQTRKRIFVTSTQNFGAIVAAQDNLAAVATNLLGVLGASSYSRSFALFSKHGADFVAEGLLGVVLPKDPGSWTAKFKTVLGSQASNLTPTEQANVEANNGNHYQTIAGIDFVSQGKTASGQFLDVIVFSDWLEARIKEEILTAMLFLDKVPFTEAGVGIIENAVLKVLDLGVTQGGLVKGTTYVRSPAVTSISSADKLLRYLDGVTFGGDLAGAVHSARLEGTLAP